MYEDECSWTKYKRDELKTPGVQQREQTPIACEKERATDDTNIDDGISETWSKNDASVITQFLSYFSLPFNARIISSMGWRSIHMDLYLPYFYAVADRNREK